MSLKQIDARQVFDELCNLKTSFLEQLACEGDCDCGQDSYEFNWQNIRVAVKRLREIMPTDPDLADGVSPTNVRQVLDFLDAVELCFHFDESEVGSAEFCVSSQDLAIVNHLIREFCPTDSTWGGSVIRDDSGLLAAKPLSAVKNVADFVAAITEDVGRSAPPQRPDVPLTDEAAPSGDTAMIGKGVAPRDSKFLEWYEAVGTDTYHKPAKIHAKWEAMKATERAGICPDSPAKVAKATVASAIKRNRKRRS